MPAGSPAYNGLWQVRTDAWSALEESTAQLALAGAQQRPVEQLTDTVAGALDVLAPIERFWAFPGMQAFSTRWPFATGKYDRCAHDGGPDQPDAGHRLLPGQPRLGRRR